MLMVILNIYVCIYNIVLTHKQPSKDTVSIF
jgi:hypothetical protein